MFIARNYLLFIDNFWKICGGSGGSRIHLDISNDQKSALIVHPGSSSPRHFSFFENDFTCNFIVTAPRNQKIVATIQRTSFDNDFSDGSECSDYVMVRKIYIYNNTISI